MDSDSDSLPDWVKQQAVSFLPTLTGPSSDSDDDLTGPPSQNAPAAKAPAAGQGVAARVQPAAAAAAATQLAAATAAARAQLTPNALQPAGTTAAAGTDAPGTQQQQPKSAAAGVAHVSQMPLILPDKLNKNKVLIELQARGGKDKDDDAAMDLSGDAGAVGRLLVSGKQGDETLRIDLKGILYTASVLPLAGTAMIINIGPTEAKVETLVNDFIRLTEEETAAGEELQEGTMADFYDADDENYQIGGDVGGDGEGDGKKIKGSKAGKAKGGAAGKGGGAAKAKAKLGLKAGGVKKKKAPSKGKGAGGGGGAAKKKAAAGAGGASAGAGKKKPAAAAKPKGKSK